MLLSNARKCFLPAVLCVLALTACGEQPKNSGPLTTPLIEPSGEFPFLTKEPEVYQAEIVAVGGGIEKKWFVARSKDRWRIDIFDGATLTRTRMRSDALYSIDHLKKTYVTIEAGGETVTDLTSRLFKGKEYRKFEKIESVDGKTKYKSQQQDGKSVVIVTIDDTSSLMTRIEFPPDQGSETPSFAYEMRDLKFEVSDPIFEIPVGYRKVSAEEFRKTEKPK